MNSGINIPVIRTSTMLIHYEIDQKDYKDLSRIELWYSREGESGWMLYDYDQDMTSPMKFVASSEGVYRFLVVAVDRWGRRSVEGVDPARLQRTDIIPADVPAQMTVFVDYTSPRLYLLSPRGVVENYIDRQLEIRWEGFDQNLPLGPVALYYRSGKEDLWKPIAQCRQARGSYVWVLPERLEGPIVVKAVITDRAGNCDVQESDQVNVVRDLPRWDVPDVYSTETSSDSPGTNGEMLGFSTMANEAVKAFRRGNLHRERLEWDKASAAYEASLKQDPEFFAARMCLANTLYEMGNYTEALKHFELCLQQKPDHPTVLFNLAKTQVALNQYDKASGTLDHYLKIDPQDSWAWLMYGDTAQKLGKSQEAMAGWQQAMKGRLMVVQEQARQRLSDHQP